MTYQEATLCKANGMSRDTVAAMIAASRDAQLRADMAVIDRAYAPRPVARPAYPSEMVCRPRVAYDYNGRSDYLLNV